MKKSIVILLLLAILSIFLASCAPQVTVTRFAEVTVTLPPTATVIPAKETSTPESTPTETAIPGPSPEQIATDITELNTAWNGVLTIDPETFQISSKVGEGAAVEGMVYNPETGKITLTFYSDGLGRDFTQQIDPSFIDFGISAGVPVKVDDIVGALRLDANGQIERVNANDDGGETSVPLRTPLEFNQMMVEDHSATASHAETPERGLELTDLLIEKGLMVKGNKGWWYFQYKDLYVKSAIGSWGSSIAYTWNPETNQYDDNEVPTYELLALDNYLDHSVGVGVWIGEDEEVKIELVAGPMNVHQMFGRYHNQTDETFAAFGTGE